MADGVLSFLLNRLSTILHEEAALLGGLRDEVQLIKDELGQMRGFLRRAERMVENDPNLKEWVCQVRDVAYDAEDILDEFILRFGRRHYDDGFLGRVRKVYGSIKNLKARHHLATKIHTIKDRIKNISDAHQRYTNQYGIFEQASISTTVQNQNQITWYDSRADALLLEEVDLVGIERTKKKLMEMLCTSDSQLHVISVVGMGGLGKTTLVKRVYDDAKSHFKHHVWVTVSQSFKIETLLNQVIRQLFKKVNQPAPDVLDTGDINSMKQVVRDLLHEGSYILVFDDVWRRADWDAIKIAFPKNNYGSRIIITTRITKVGQAATCDTAGHVYPLEPLTKEESWSLFCKKAFRSTSCPHHLEEILGNIIERCAGLPLAIVVIGGVMATKSRRTEEWELFNRSLGEQIVGDDQLENMTRLLSLSYYDLPDHLRICFLYFSILPEDVSIRRTRLIRLWIAEGFVEKREGMTIEEVAGSYLNELINRSLVQVAKKNTDGQVKACRVHDIVHQIIFHKAREQGITAIFSEQGMQFSDKIRRLVIHSPIDNNQVVNNGLLKRLRSLVSLESIYSISEPFLSVLLSDGLRLLKVLELKSAPLEAIPNEIFKLSHLRYLSLRNTKVKTVPKLIGKLQKLVTLDLKYTNVKELPVEILKLQQLRHLLVDDNVNGVQAPCKIGNLQSLQSLGYIDANEIGIVKEIGKLTQLRKLGITNLRRENGRELCSSLEKLTNLRSLYVRSVNKDEVIDLHYPLSSTPRFLRKLELKGRLEKAPQWIPSLQGLTRIYLYYSRLMEDPLQLLQDLPNLVQLALWIASEGEGLCFKAGGFQGLKKLWMSGLQELRWLRVEKGAMPFLEELIMGSCELIEELPTGIQHLKSLQMLAFYSMSDRFVKKLEDMEKGSEDYNKIAHIPQVLITKWVGDEIKKRNLSMRPEMQI